MAKILWIQWWCLLMVCSLGVAWLIGDPLHYGPIIALLINFKIK